VEKGERVWGACESVKLTVRPLGEAFLQAYLDREYEAVRWNVGSYRVEGMGAQLFEEIDGSHFAVLGLPLLPLLAFLRERGVLQS
jgi:septum formation protein